MSPPFDQSSAARLRLISQLASNPLIGLVQVDCYYKSAEVQIQHDTIKYLLLQSACRTRFPMPHTSIVYCRMAVIGPG